jgi:hypothetical protein
MCALCDPTGQILSGERPNIFAPPGVAPHTRGWQEPGGVFAATRTSSATIQGTRSDSARRRMPPLACRPVIGGVVALAVASVLALIVVIAPGSDPRPAAARRAIAPTRAEHSIEPTPGEGERGAETGHRRVRRTARGRQARRPHRPRRVAPAPHRRATHASTTAPADAPVVSSAPRPTSPGRAVARPRASAAPRRPQPVPAAAPPEFM